MGTDSLQKIGDIAEVFDGPHATPQKIEDGPYFLSISSLVNGQLDLAKSARLSDEQFVKWTRRVTPQEGDVLFSYETRLGEAALMPPNVKACLGRRMGLLRPNRDRVLPEYLLYAYLAPEFQEQIKRKTNHGATVERIALKELPDFDIRIPAIEEQSKVVKVLNNLSWKLKLNQQIN
jgi:type I restriction enzyme S subunit